MRTILAWWLLCSCSLTGLAQEFRGIWVDAFGPGFQSSEEVRELVANCRKYNFNAVFVQMRKRGDAFYNPGPHNPEPKAGSIQATFDPLAELIKQCHNGDKPIQVHCWLNSYLVWASDKPPLEKEHVYNSHPEFLSRDSIGQKIFAEGYYLDPGHPGVGAWLLHMAQDIVGRYDIDGLQWDYLRYPAGDSGYNEVALLRFKSETGAHNDPDPKDAAFGRWRTRQITDFLRWSSAELLALKPKLAISVSVFSNYDDSRNYRFADWAEWNREGILDLCLPMDFSTDKLIFTSRAEFAYTNRGARVVYLGQGAYKNSKENTLAQLALAREMGVKGTVLFSYRMPAETNVVATPVKRRLREANNRG